MLSRLALMGQTAVLGGQFLDLFSPFNDLEVTCFPVDRAFIGIAKAGGNDPSAGVVNEDDETVRAIGAVPEGAWL